MSIDRKREVFYHVRMTEKEKRMRTAAAAIHTITENMLELHRYPKVDFKAIIEIAELQLESASGSRARDPEYHVRHGKKKY